MVAFDEVGGFIGYLEDGSTISDSFASGNVTGTYDVGGFIGYVDMDDGDGLIKNSYAIGNVHGSNIFEDEEYEGDSLGGFFGYADEFRIINSFSRSVITYDEGFEDVGGFGGYTYEEPELFQNNYYDFNRSGGKDCISTVSLGEDCIAVNGSGEDGEPSSAPNYFYGNHTNAPLNSWDFDTVWGDNGEGFPYLRSMPSVVEASAFDTTAPGPITDLTAEVNEDGEVHFNWTNPADEDFYGVTILRSDYRFINYGFDYEWRKHNVSGTSSMDEVWPGTYHYSLFAIDNGGNFSSVVTTSILFEVDTPVIETVTTTVTTSSISMSWTTNVETNGYLLYGLNSYGNSSSYVDDEVKTFSHTVTISDLSDCTSFLVRPVSSDRFSNYVEGEGDEITTLGCSADVIPGSIQSASVDYSSDTTTTLSLDSGSLTVFTPSNFVSSSVVIQIKSLTASSVLASIGKPSGKNTGSNIVFDVKALVDNSTLLDSFNLPVTISYNYSNDDVSGLNESSVWLYHYHDNVWSALDDCTIDQEANLITCTTPSFSVFALFGNAVSTPPPSSGGGGGGAGPTIIFGCTDKNALNYNPYAGMMSGDTKCLYKEVKDAVVSSTTTTIPQSTVTPANQLSCSANLYLKNPVKYGVKNNVDDVKLLQKFLNTYEGENLVVDGKYAKVDYEAVIRWQEKYADEILKPWGIKKGTGYIYTTSLNKIKQIHENACKEKAQSSPQQNSATVDKYIFKRTLKLGSTGDDVLKLQIFLNNNGYTIAAKGPGSAGNETKTFGQATKKALAKFQEDHRDEVLSPFGLKSGTGVFGTATMQLVNKL